MEPLFSYHRPEKYLSDCYLYRRWFRIKETENEAKIWKKVTRHVEDPEKGY